MTRFSSLQAFVAGCVATAATTWLAVDLDAQRILFDPATSIHVCVASDGVMRFADMTAECPAGQQSLFLKKAEADLELKDQTETKRKEDRSSDRASLDSKALADLEGRVKALEDLAGRGELGNRVVAPFEVVDRDGKRVFYVSRQGSAVYAELYNAAGDDVARLAATATGGQFVGQASDSSLGAYVGVFENGSGAGLRVLDAGSTRVDLGRDGGTGRYRLKILGRSGLAAAIGEDQDDGTGLVIVGGADGQPRATIGVGVDGGVGGVFSVIGTSRTLLAQLMEDESGAGYLSLRNSSGEKMVGAGTRDGIGFVGTGPSAFKPGMGLLGLPSSFISGKR
jgi:hypothetical protein